jgi:hypothetical protein
MQKHLFNLTLTLLAGLFLSAAACQKEDVEAPVSVGRNIAGTWEMQSFKLGDVDIQGTIVQSSTLEIMPETASTGKFNWIIRYSDGALDQTGGNYTMDETKNEIHFKAGNGQELTFQYSFNGNQFALTGMKDGDKMELAAVRN